jgi:hypothetical protein
MPYAKPVQMEQQTHAIPVTAQCIELWQLHQALVFATSAFTKREAISVEVNSKILIFI